MARCKIAPTNWPTEKKEQMKHIKKFMNFRKKRPEVVISKDNTLIEKRPGINKKPKVPKNKHTPKTTSTPKSQQGKKTKRKNVSFSPIKKPKRTKIQTANESSGDEDQFDSLAFFTKYIKKTLNKKKD